MSATAVSGWIAVTAASSSICGSKSVAKQPQGAQGLVPVTGLVNRMQGLQLRKLRWQQVQKSARAAVDVRECWRAQGSKTTKAISINESQFEAEVLQSSIPVLVDFWATWCGPCRLMGITLDWAAQEYDGKVKCVKIETDRNAGLVDKYKVYGLPTLMLFVNGEIVPNTQREGALNKEKLQMYLEKNLTALAPTS